MPPPTEPSEPTGAARARRALPPAHLFALYLGVPACAAMLMAWMPAGARAPLMPNALWAALYWFGLLLPGWLAMDLCTRALGRLQRAVGLRLPLLVLLLGGAVLATLALRPYLIYYWAAVDRVLFAPDVVRPLSAAPALWPTSLREFFGAIERASVLIGLWVLANLFYARVLGFDRYGTRRAAEPSAAVASGSFEPDASPEPAAASPGASSVREAFAAWAPPAPARERPAPPPFAQRLSRDLGTDVIALHAQDHYVRVTTRRGSELILYRFSDAVRELPAEAGVRAHRSWWVACTGVQRLVQRGGRQYLLLVDGQRVPVSRTYLDRVRERLVDAPADGRESQVAVAAGALPGGRDPHAWQG